MHTTYFLFIVLFIMNACSSRKINRTVYFNIDSLLNRQILMLTENQAILAKVSKVDDVTDSSTFSPDSLGWSNEFEVFRYLDIINKPIFDGAYQQQNDVKDETSNLKVRVLKATTEIPVKEFIIYHQEGLEHIRKIEAVVEEKNSLFFSSRKLSLEFDNYRDKMLISRYLVSGIQKMILSDTVHYSIQANVTIN